MTTHDALRITFAVHASVERAFEVWTARAGLWWPKDHTVSGDPDRVEFEPFTGGRILERGKDGSEHIWGEVTHWDAPHRLSFWWHLFFDREQATHVTITFEPEGGQTRVQLEQTGFDALGEAGQLRREGTKRGWDATIAAFVVAVAQLSD